MSILLRYRYIISLVIVSLGMVGLIYFSPIINRVLLYTAVNETREVLSEEEVRQYIDAQVRQHDDLSESKAEILSDFFYKVFQRINTDDESFLLEWISHSITLIPGGYTYGEETADNLENRLKGVFEKLEKAIDIIDEPITSYLKEQTLKKSDYIYDYAENAIINFVRGFNKVAVHKSLESTQLSDVAAQFREGVKFAAYEGPERQILREEIVSVVAKIASIKDYTEEELERSVNEFLVEFAKSAGFTDEQVKTLYIVQPRIAGMMLLEGTTSFILNYEKIDSQLVFGGLYRSTSHSEDDFIIYSRDDISIY